MEEQTPHKANGGIVKTTRYQNEAGVYTQGTMPRTNRIGYDHDISARGETAYAATALTWT